MGQRTDKEYFHTEEEAKERAERLKARATPGYSEIYITGPFCQAGVWVVEWTEYYG